MAIWLRWAAREFSVAGDSDTVNTFVHNFRVRHCHCPHDTFIISLYVPQLDGKSLCRLSKEEFCRQAPGQVGELLWAHFQELLSNSNNNNSTYPMDHQHTLSPT